MEFGAFAQPRMWFFSVLAVVLLSAPAHAALVISTGATANVTCAAGTCTATAKSAVLNVSELQSLLGTGPVRIAAGDIDFKSTLTWIKHHLSLDAGRSIYIEAPLIDGGDAPLSLHVHRKGRGVVFGPAGNITFWSTGAKFSINRQIFKLENDIDALAADMAAAPSGNFALARRIDVSTHAAFANAPLPQFSGWFTGLGNAITGLTVNSAATYDSVGLFAQIDRVGTVENLRLDGNFTGAQGSAIGALTGYNAGFVRHVSVSGKIQSSGANVYLGGLVGVNGGVIFGCFGKTDIAGGDQTNAGGIAGINGWTLQGAWGGTIANSGSSQRVKVGTHANAGGAVGLNQGWISDTFAWSAVNGGTGSYVGGLVGNNVPNGSNGGTLLGSYSIGPATGAPGSFVGGIAGYNNIAPAPGAGAQPHATAQWARNYYELDSSLNTTAVGGGFEPPGAGVHDVTAADLGAEWQPQHTVLVAWCPGCERYEEITPIVALQMASQADIDFNIETFRATRRAR